MMSINKSLAVLLMMLSPAIAAWGWSGDKVLLRDVSTLTLYADKKTNGRRSAPVPQLDCIPGGTASCSAFKPRTVQCYNRGSDGIDVQWECKADMDRAYRFGHVEVSCEGYDYPDDPYVLQGSCGLRYNIDYTGEGQHSYSNSYDSYDQYAGSKTMSYASKFADIIVYCALGLVFYALYKTCISSRSQRSDAYSTTNDDYPAGGGGGQGGGYGWFGGSNNPNSHYYNDYGGGASCTRNRYNNTTGGSGSGFWTGAATGGLLGYMFGQSGRNNYGYRHQPSYGFSSFGGGGWGSSSSGRREAPPASYSSSGFGGTSRR